MGVQFLTRLLVLPLACPRQRLFWQDLVRHVAHLVGGGALHLGGGALVAAVRRERLRQLDLFRGEVRQLVYCAVFKRLFNAVELGRWLAALPQHAGLRHVVVALRRDVLHGALSPHVVVARPDGLRHACGIW
ncbi:unnamed protein product [Chrysodeixis includens]|uniref:Uncharacterized protein n=1 Tax=Chrysodeixis includens TaxID=689277 RepID=A0A9N8Q026_CHRIL|nr:unnamed protein product [Chrysodeixis includens]